MADGQVDVRIGSTPHGTGLISSAQRSLAAGPWQWLSLGAVVGAAILADQFTKYEVLHRLGPDDSAETFGPVSIHRIENPGIAFGLFSSATSIVIVLTVVAVGWMLTYFARSGARHPIIPAGLGLLVGGSLANLIDRVRLGHVTDFIDVGLGSAFNLADSFIVCGVIALLGALLTVDRRPGASRRHRVA